MAVLNKRKIDVTKITFQLKINLMGLYIANQVSINIWRSLTGH